jgi:thioredoxin-like negative regulator of GroEL
MRPRTFRRCSKFSGAILVLLCATAGAADAPPPVGDGADAVDTAVVRAHERHAPVLVDIHAPWCYSCYFMTRNVQTGAEWDAVQKRAVVAELDADTPEGARRMQQWQVKALPSYVVLDEQGRELGRIVGEQTRADYYRQLNDLFARTASIADLAARVTDGKAPSIVAARDLLAAYHSRGDADSGIAWWNSLTVPVRTALDRDPPVKLWVQRLHLLKASQTGNAAQCAAIAPPVFAGDLGCERPYEVDRVMECTADLPQAQRTHVLGGQKVALARLLYSRIFIAKPSCADARSAVLTEAELDQQLGYPKAAAVILREATEDVKKRLNGDLKKDRNLADNLRVYLDHAGKLGELDALFPKLIAAYPDDYVYPYRYAKSLAARGRYAQALPFFEQAEPKAYGLNRLNVAEGHAETLVKLGRAADAKAVVADALKANGPWFPEQAEKLKAVVVNAN